MSSQLIIFDCDGVLIDSEIISARMLREEAASLGVDISITYILRHFVGRSFPTVRKVIEAQFAATLPDFFESNYRARLLAAFENELQAMAGIVDVLTRLGQPYCVATSSSPERVARSLAITKLAPYFEDRVFTASEVRRGKPAPDLFLHVAAKMGFDPAQSIVIEDSSTGVEAGLAAGMRTLRFTGGSHIIDKADKAGAELAFDNFADFFDHIGEN